MDMTHGKAISGGKPLNEDELESLAKDQLAALRDAFSTKRPVAKSEDVLDVRLAEELRLVKRMLELVENEMRAKGQQQAADEIERGEDAIEDLAEVVEAEDPCDAIEQIDSDIARRLTRRGLDGSAAPCDNRAGERPSILRKAS